jgi:hypothetical protein
MASVAGLSTATIEPNWGTIYEIYTGAQFLTGVAYSLNGRKPLVVLSKMKVGDEKETADGDIGSKAGSR